ncbi:MAG: glycosyltransferase [Phototrophicaceae bacterium]
MSITLISTVLNEGDNIHHMMNGLLQQTRQADEIIIVDGGSSDNTVATIRTYDKQLPLKVLIREGCNISEGRNTAIDAAQGDIIVITDAGTRLHATWLEHITQPLLDDAALSVVAGFFKADPQNTFETAMGATVLPLENEIDPVTFLPSSRSVALHKAAAQAIDGYPEWLDYCEDLVFDMRLQKTQAPFYFQPDALVYFRPRGTLASYFKQYYRYARGDGKANLWRKRHIIRYITYLVITPIVLLLSALVNPLFLGLFFIGGAVYLYQPYRRLPTVMRDNPQKSPFAWLQAIMLIPVIRVVGDIAKMIGYPVGLVWRNEHQPPDWQIIDRSS